MTTRPKIRPDLEFIPVIHEGNRMILVRDSASSHDRVLLEILPRSKGEVLDYGIYREEATGSAVTFDAAAFTVCPETQDKKVKYSEVGAEEIQ
jgi:hypothetical protein